jgi:hypothetical protein
MMPAVGDSPLFIDALKDLVLEAIGLQAAALVAQASAQIH